MVFQMLDSFRGNYRIECLVRPGKRCIKICLHKVLAEKDCRSRINIRADSIEASFFECQSERSTATAWGIKNSRIGGQPERWQVLQHGILNHGEPRGVHAARRFLRTSS